ncbi:hypothetical protein [Desulfonatronum parangueonense]
MPDSSFEFTEQLVPLNWNGLLLQTPTDWTPSVLDGRYLLAEAGDVPVMEVKWQPIQGRFSVAKTIRKLTKGVQGAELFIGENDARTPPVPEQWTETVSRLEEHGFNVQPIFWRSSDLRTEEMSSQNITAGRGALIYNPVPNMAWLIQFYETGTGSIKEDAARVLLSLRSPEPEQWLPWQVFGIRFRTPSWLELMRHTFNPGRYRLEFRGRGWKNATRLVLERVGPARAVLRGAGLREWAEGYFAKELASLKPVDGRPNVAEVRWQQLPGRILHRGSRACVRLSRDGQMILAVFLLNARVAELNVFQEIDQTYGIV